MKKTQNNIDIPLKISAKNVCRTYIAKTMFTEEQNKQ